MKESKHYEVIHNKFTILRNKIYSQSCKLIGFTSFNSNLFFLYSMEKTGFHGNIHHKIL